MTLTLHKSQVCCSGVMSLQFTHVRSFTCRGRLRSLQAESSTVGLYCVTIKWQQNLKSFTSSYGSRRFPACDCWCRVLGR